jgi:hypothetical protein
MSLTPEQKLIVAILEKDFADGKDLSREEVALVFQMLTETKDYAEDLRACLVNIVTCKECHLCDQGSARMIVTDLRAWAEYENNA